jgi:hypothetical protein
VLCANCEFGIYYIKHTTGKKTKNKFFFISEGKVRETGELLVVRTARQTFFLFSPFLPLPLTGLSSFHLI